MRLSWSLNRRTLKSLVTSLPVSFGDISIIACRMNVNGTMASIFEATSYRLHSMAHSAADIALVKSITLFEFTHYFEHHIEFSMFARACEYSTTIEVAFVHICAHH